MAFVLRCTTEAHEQYTQIMERANHPQPELGKVKKKPSKQLGLAKQVSKTLALLAENTVHPTIWEDDP